MAQSAAVRVAKTRAFGRWADKQSLTDRQLCQAVDEMHRGLIDADLGGGLLKKRVARPGRGKSAGWRTVVATDGAQEWIFVYGFAKNERDNIDDDELAVFKEWAKELLGLTDATRSRMVRDRSLEEVDCNAQEDA